MRLLLSFYLETPAMVGVTRLVVSATTKAVKMEAEARALKVVMAESQVV
jgi:hypothetical protein